MLTFGTDSFSPETPEVAIFLEKQFFYTTFRFDLSMYILKKNSLNPSSTPKLYSCTYSVGNMFEVLKQWYANIRVQYINKGP